MNNDTANDEKRQHKLTMQKKNAIFKTVLAHKTIERGLVIINIGDGKGKSTAAFGMVFRALGHGKKIAIAQFIKGAQPTGELLAMAKFSDQVTVARYGEGFTWQTQDRQRDIALAEKTWCKAKEFIANREIDMVLLDELNYALSFGYLDSEEVVDVVKHRQPDKHVIITGRNPPRQLLEIADLVTEMKMIKHPFTQGVKPQPGIEF